jgi:four helix bundle protein
MEKSKNFRDLIVWQKAHALALSGYKMTAAFPKEELFGLTSQIRRSAISIPANIAEEFKKKGKADKLRFMNIAEGSLEELKYYLILTNDLNYCQTNEIF